MTDRLEQDLRRMLHDPRRSPASPPDIIERVHTGMARRRARRRVAAASAAALAVVLVAGVSALLTGDGRPASAGAVPWLDAPVGPYTPPPQVTSSPRPAASACRGADLRLVGVDREGATGHAGNFVHVENVGPNRCTLSGSLELTGLNGAGTRVPIPAEGGTFFDQLYSGERPATIGRREQASLTIETSLSCEGGAPASTTTYRRVQIRLADGTTFDVADRLDSTCPFRIGTWYRPVQPPPEPPEPWPTLHARLEGVPATVRAGEPLDYVVELANTGKADVTFDPCPAYAEALGGARADYRLNCAAAAVIPAGGSVRFAMRLDVGTDVPSGPAKMVWSLHGSTVAAGTVVRVIR
ncbi:MAG TPA: hypothetical protein VEK80_16930 [Kribbellaceae bacterium]|nr:hypothetical protein [Kribbellaceae bacterium]